MIDTTLVRMLLPQLKLSAYTLPLLMLIQLRLECPVQHTFTPTPGQARLNTTILYTLGPYIT